MSEKNNNTKGLYDKWTLLFMGVAVVLVLYGCYDAEQKRMEEITSLIETKRQTPQPTENRETRIMIENTKEVLGGKFLYEGKIYIPELSAKDIVDKSVVYKSEHFLQRDELIDLQPFQCVQEDSGEKVICHFLFDEDISPEIKAVGKMPGKAEEKTPTKN